MRYGGYSVGVGSEVGSSELLPLVTERQELVS